MGVARMLRMWRSHHPYVDFFCWRVSRLRTPRIKKEQMEKTNLLACCLCLEYWQKVDSKSRHFVEKRTSVGIDIKLEGLRDRLPRPAPSGRVTECGPVRSCITIMIMCHGCTEKNGVTSRWRFRWNKNLKIRRSKEGGELIFFAVFDELSVESLGSSWKVGACRSLLRRRLRSWSCRYGRGESCWQVFRRRFSVVIVMAIRWRLWRPPFALPMFGWIDNVYRLHLWAPRRCLCQGDYAKRFSGVWLSTVPSTVHLRRWKWPVLCRLLACIGTKKTACVGLAVSGE